MDRLELEPEARRQAGQQRGVRLLGSPDTQRLAVAEHERLANLLADPGISAEASGPTGPCPGGSTFRLTAGAIETAWTECDSADHPLLDALLRLIESVAPF